MVQKSRLQARASLEKGISRCTISYFSVVYIVMVNATILSDAGIPLQGAMLGTLLTSMIGCLLMAFGGKSPMVVVPGMGINAFFTYTLVHSMKLSWQEALMVVAVTGVIFAIVVFYIIVQAD